MRSLLTCLLLFVSSHSFAGQFYLGHSIGIGALAGFAGIGGHAGYTFRNMEVSVGGHVLFLTDVIGQASNGNDGSSATLDIRMVRVSNKDKRKYNYIGPVIGVCSSSDKTRTGISREREGIAAGIAIGTANRLGKHSGFFIELVSKIGFGQQTENSNSGHGVRYEKKIDIVLPVVQVNVGFNIRL